MADDTNLQDDLNTDDPSQSDDGFYADDVQAQAIAENSLDPEELDIDDEDPVTSGNLEIGDLDIDLDDDEISFDEEDTPAGDNVYDF